MAVAVAVAATATRPVDVDPANFNSLRTRSHGPLSDLLVIPRGYIWYDILKLFPWCSHDIPQILCDFRSPTDRYSNDRWYVHLKFPHTSDTGWWFTYPSEKYGFVSWDDEIPIWKVIKFMFTTNQNSIIIDIPSGKSPMFNRKTNYVCGHFLCRKLISMAIFCRKLLVYQDRYVVNIGKLT